MNLKKFCNLFKKKSKHEKETISFKEFWVLLQDELKQEKEFTTLKQDKKFKARFETNKNGEKVVIITPEHSEIQRGAIPYNEFEGIWNNVKDRSYETRFENYNDIKSYTRKDDEIGKSMQASYITALINYIVKDQNME